MNDTVTLYVLLFPTIFNSAILLALAVVLYRMLLIISDFTKRFDVFMDQGQKELFSTAETVRKTTSTVNSILEKVNLMMERHLFLSSMKSHSTQSTQSSTKFSQIMSGVEVGVGIFNLLRNLFSKKN